MNPLSDFTGFDLVALAIVGLSTLLAFAHGAIREMLTIGAWAGALVVGYHGFAPVNAIAVQTIETPWLADVATLVVVFLVPLLIFKVLSAVLADRFDDLGIGFIDRTIGALFGFARGAVIVCVLYLGMTLVLEPEDRPLALETAKTRPYVELGADWLRGFFPFEAESGPRASERTTRT